jgi:hypothetical protein
LNRLTHHWLKIKEWKPYDSDSAYSPVGTILLNQPLNPRSWDDDWNHRWGLHDYSGTPELGYDYDYNEVTEDFELYNRGAIPSKTQVETTIKQYLTLAKGHFETAYWMLEQAYDDLEADTTALGQDQLNLLEAAIFALQADEDYIDATSISNNYGGAQWQRQLIEAN